MCLLVMAYNKIFELASVCKVGAYLPEFSYTLEVVAYMLAAWEVVAAYKLVAYTMVAWEVVASYR